MEKRLARGLEAFLGKSGVPVSQNQTVQALPVSSIHPNPRQPRREFDEGKLKELQDSIARDGLLQPIVVRSRGDEGYEIIAGERRWRACRSLGMPRIPAMIRTVDEDQQLVLALVENLQRADLNAIEEATALRRLLDEFGLTHEEVAKRVGRERSTVSNTMRLLELPEEARLSVSRGTISAGHGRALLPLVGRPEFATLLSRTMSEGWSVRQTEQEVRNVLNPPERSGEPPEGQRHATHRPLKRKDANLRDLEDRIRGRWGVLTTIRARRRGGQVILDCKSREEFDDLLERLEGASWSRGGRVRENSDDDEDEDLEFHI